METVKRTSYETPSSPSSGLSYDQRKSSILIGLNDNDNYCISELFNFFDIHQWIPIRG